MYKVVVVDDEPVALNHVCNIIKKKCPTFEVIGMAGSATEAIRLIETHIPDLVITDIHMPGMNGISLSTWIKEHFPEILTIIVSGYSEFEYAKKALKTGVSEYLLKPLTPPEMIATMNVIENKLKHKFYIKRNNLIRALCNNENIEARLINKYFAAGKYYVAIVRKNGLPRRFERRSGFEIFSNEEENFYLYGRDEFESLYLIPEIFFNRYNYKKMIERLFDSTKSEQFYITLLTSAKTFELEKISETIANLYRCLNERIVIGANQLLYIETLEPFLVNNTKEREAFEKLEHALRIKDTRRLFAELNNIFSLWEKHGFNQIYIEGRIKYLLQIIMNVWVVNIDKAHVEYLIDDVFFDSVNMGELRENTIDIIKLCFPELKSGLQDDKDQLFDTIIRYIKNNLAESISISKVCKEFGVSQTMLSRMFRKNLDTSFNNYITVTRINQAKQLMKSNENTFIKDIALQVGYTDQFYFSRIFRTVTGTSPKQYMDSL
ncbi:MAG: response regulator [Defluviitaleaceae bacterium]|nr:response regulator [Defluviitaleaceae bacterium]